MGKQRTTHPVSPARILPWLALLLTLGLFLPLALPASAQTASVSATTIPLILPSAIVFDAQGNLYFAETASHIIRKIDTSGHITTIAGTGAQGFSGDAGPAISAQLDSPQGLALDANQNLYIADSHNHRIRKLSLATGTITTVAGNSASGFSGDSALATSAKLNLPTALAFDSFSNLYIADTQNHRIRRLAISTSIITTVAGTGTQGFSGDNGPATAASIDSPTGLATDSAGNLYLADTHNHRIRKITAATGDITTLAGTGAAGYYGDTGPGTAATLALPHGLTIDAGGNLYLADTANHRIRRIDASTGIITNISGNSVQTFNGDNTSASTASLDAPRAPTISPSGLLTIADTGNQRIRQIGTDFNIRTIAGLGVTAPGALTLTAPSVIAYGTGQLTATLSTTTAATGSITFLDTVNSSTAALGSATLTANSATLSTGILPVGIHALTATYPGDLSHSSAQSPVFTLTISPRPIAATITPSRVIYGQAIPALNANVTGILPQDSSGLTVALATSAAALSPVGTYPITATLTGPAAGNYTLTASLSSLAIVPAPTVTTLSASADTIGTGLPVTFTTHVASTTAGTPTGIISLVDGATTLFTANVPETGDAAFTTSSLNAGVHTLTTTYTGDPNFTPSTSAPQLIGIGTSPNPDFTLSPTGSATQTILSGGSASFSFAVQLQGATLSSPIALSATGLPNLATASFTPNYLPPGATPGTFTLTISTPKTASLPPEHTTPQTTLAFLILPIAPLIFRSRRRRSAIYLFTLLTLPAIFCLGCGDRVYTGSKSATASTTYKITVTGTATAPTGATLSHAATVTLTVQ